MTAYSQKWQKRFSAANKLIVNNTKELNQAFEALSEATREGILDAMIAQLIDCYGRLVVRTPYKTGRARVAWHIDGESNEWKPEPGDYKDAQGQAARIIEKQVSKLQGLTDADIIYIMNNVEYILPLEVGWSRQNSGFIALFLSELKMQLENAAQAWSQLQ